MSRLPCQQNYQKVAPSFPTYPSKALQLVNLKPKHTHTNTRTETERKREYITSFSYSMATKTINFQLPAKFTSPMHMLAMFEGTLALLKTTEEK